MTPNNEKRKAGERELHDAITDVVFSQINIDNGDPKYYSEDKPPKYDLKCTPSELVSEVFEAVIKWIRE